MRIIENDMDLVNLGFKKYPVPVFDSDRVLAFYQKRVEDENGVKYHLDCRKWDMSFLKNHPTKVAYDFSVQLSNKKSENRFNIDFLSPDYDEAIETIESLFTSGVVKYEEEY